MNLEKKNIRQVSGTSFYVNKKNPNEVSYRIPTNPNNWKYIKLEFLDMEEPKDDEILYYYNELRGFIIKLNDLV